MRDDSVGRIISICDGGRLTLTNTSHNPADSPLASAPEQRETPRYALLLRSAKLLDEAGEYLCIVRDVSESGLKLRLFHSLPGDGHYTLENASGELFDVEVVWEREGEAGLRFVTPIDVTRFIAETGPFPKRPIRLRVQQDATITVAGSRSAAKILDLSREGACIEVDAHLAIAQPLRLESPILPSIEATVCWRRHPSYGLAFRQVLSLSDLAQRALRMQISGS